MSATTTSTAVWTMHAERWRTSIVKASAKRLLAHLHDKLVLDWRRKADAMADVRSTIGRVLDADLPGEPYQRAVFDAKVQAVSTT